MQRLTAVDNIWDSEPTWSPDGTRIAFCRIDPNRAFRSEIWVMNADGAGTAQLTNNSVFDDLAR